MSAHVWRKLSNCKRVRQADDLKSRDGSSTEKGGRRQIKVREAGEQGTGGGRFWPPCPIPPWFIFSSTHKYIWPRNVSKLSEIYVLHFLFEIVVWIQAKNRASCPYFEQTWSKQNIVLVVDLRAYAQQRFSFYIVQPSTAYHLERFSFECRKTKTKEITLANHKEHRQYSEPIKTSLEVITCSWRKAREAMTQLVLVLLLIGWKSGANLLSQSRSVVNAKPITFRHSNENLSKSKERGVFLCAVQIGRTHTQHWFLLPCGCAILLTMKGDRRSSCFVVAFSTFSSK